MSRERIQDGEFEIEVYKYNGNYWANIYLEGRHGCLIQHKDKARDKAIQKAKDWIREIR